ncbi:MAG: serine/threonine protein kinase [Betaproteobacteria bacterium]
MPRQIKDEYEIIAEIGAGGMATVYKAVQKSLDRMVAIKELKKAFHADDQIVKRFERESRVAASLQHENIVHIYDYWKKPNYAIVMEYVDGTTLADVIEKTGALPVDVGIMIAVQVSNALDYAHMRGFVHRDIKPSNVMIKRNGEVKLMDFGIAQSRNLESLTIPGMLIGTPAYMSPEQILGQQLDVRSDVFSFGIVLYEMFTGVKPFNDEDTRSITAKIMKDKFPEPRRVNGEIPRRLQWLIKKCLRKKPQRRYASMMEVGKKLGKRLAGKTTKAASLLQISDYLVSRNMFEAAPEQETLIVPPKSARSGRVRGALVAAALAFLMATGVAAYYYRTAAIRPFDHPPVILPASPGGAPLATRPQIITETTSTAHPTAREGMVSSSAGTTQPAPSVPAQMFEAPVMTQPQAATETTPTVPHTERRSPVTSSTNTVQQPLSPPAAVEKKQESTAPAGKKADPVKKKKKKKKRIEPAQ